MYIYRAYFYAETNRFLQEQQEDVVKRCVAAEPHHGVTWQAVAKDMKNTGKTVAEILELVTATLQ